MKNKLFFFPLLCIFLFSQLPALNAQTTQTASTNTVHFDMSGFPLWAKDLRRAEIIAFGSFPFMYFFSNFAFDSYRFAAHGWNRRYAPWPLTSSAAIEKTKEEKFITLGIAAGGAVVMALVDYAMVRYKRHRLEEEARRLEDGSPIIIRKPLDEEGGGTPLGATPIDESPLEGSSTGLLPGDSPDPEAAPPPILTP